MPERIQLRRTKGWRKPPSAIVVARPTRWGNPYAIGEGHVQFHGETRGDVGFYGQRDLWADLPLDRGLTAEEAVQLYRAELINSLADPDPYFDDLRDALLELRGHDLACWCPAAQPCHADVLLEVANA